MVPRGCPKCEVDSAGNHQLHCPNRPKISEVDKFLAALNPSAVNIHGGPVQILIGQYIELLSAFAMTLDAIELTGDKLEIYKLEKVCLFIEKALKSKIDEIVVLQENL